MGPRYFERGDDNFFLTGYPGYDASMGPRYFERGDVAVTRSCQPAPVLLQWGRAISSAEIDSLQRVPENIAELQWGRAISSAEMPPISNAMRIGIIASMGPRYFERGDHEAPHNIWIGTTVASMGPRYFERGDVADLRDVGCLDVLQWGRAISSAEIEQARPNPHRNHTASMGPRYFERGDRRIE